MKSREELRSEFVKKHLGNDYKIDMMQADASFRSYYRIFIKDKTFILMDAPPEKENILSFIEIDKLLIQKNFSAPEIYFQDLENGFLLLSDFGNTTYNNVLSNSNQFTEYPSEERLYERAVDVLINLQKNSENVNLPDYSNLMLIEESLIFIDWYISVFNGEQLKSSSKDKFKLILQNLFIELNKYPKVIVLRDYHADNLFWLDNEIGIKKVGLIDFQDAVLGSPAYDMVSLLEDARRDVPEEIVINSISRYLKAFPEYTRKDFMAIYNILGVQRNLKIIGIFTRQAYKYKNNKYLGYLPRVWHHVFNNLKHPLLLPLKDLLEEILPSQMNSMSANNLNKKILV